MEMDIKIKIKKELEEFDNGFNSADVQYMQSQLSTEVDIKDVKKETQDNDSGISQISNKIETKNTLRNHSYHKQQQISQHPEETILNNNVIVQIGQKPYKCEICSKTYTQGNNLKIHLRTHTGEKPCRCEICFKTFASSDNLKGHLRVHTGEKLYKCEMCFKTYTTAENLKIHFRAHTGDKPYKCEICLRQFSQQSNLTTHKKLHTGEKPYKCGICFKTFTRAD
ncbi:uncharacterized protein [Diabrotica undecimpunctata]|uniref:uncharacterized protein isoform X6 n=1 Tax=Diabrotica undecimpunctata TaxID=50387 RepID=UPI003B6332EF